MPTAITDEFRAALYAQQTDVIPVLLAVLRSTAIEDGVLRLCDYRENITSNGQVYSAFPCDMILASDVEGRVTGGQVRLFDFSGEIKKWLRNVTDQPLIDLSVVTVQQPDSVQARTPQLAFLSGTMPAGLIITIDLSLPGSGRIMFPHQQFTPNTYPGAF